MILTLCGFSCPFALMTGLALVLVPDARFHRPGYTTSHSAVVAVRKGLVCSKSHPAWIMAFVRPPSSKDGAIEPAQAHSLARAGRTPITIVL
ncbi:hypothetical protein GQ44DRAFT_713896 [Phaeosphaeriaceae sp. PMI808]|nr:hypothetical protein GQ44DRAFT_713896 [Phaeosphaeriaceae sp. PMI808]